MKTKEELKELKEEIELLNKKLAELTDDALQQVTGGHSEFGTLERILNELSSWLEVHPYATKSDIYDLLNKMKAENADILTVDELNALNELLNTFTE